MHRRRWLTSTVLLLRKTTAISFELLKLLIMSSLTVRTSTYRVNWYSKIKLTSFSRAWCLLWDQSLLKSKSQRLLKVLWHFRCTVRSVRENIVTSRIRVQVLGHAVPHVEETTIVRTLILAVRWPQAVLRGWYPPQLIGMYALCSVDAGMWK